MLLNLVAFIVYHISFIFVMFCSWNVSPSHLDSSGGPGLSLGGYFCPQCHAKYTELPVECKVCGMSVCVCALDLMNVSFFLFIDLTEI